MQDALPHIIIGLRCAVTVAWMIVGFWGLPCMWRAILGTQSRSDGFFASLLLLAIGLLIFQFRSLAGVTLPESDPWTATGLLSLLLSAFGIIIAKALKSPEGHKRAMLVSHLTVLGICLMAGALS